MLVIFEWLGFTVFSQSAVSKKAQQILIYGLVLLIAWTLKNRK